MKIIEDGLFDLETTAVSSSVVYVSGSLGGGVATLGYTDDDGFIPLTDGVVAVGSQFVINHGSNMHVFIQLVGASGADLTVISKGA